MGALKPEGYWEYWWPETLFPMSLAVCLLLSIADSAIQCFNTLWAWACRPLSFPLDLLLNLLQPNAVSLQWSFLAASPGLWLD